MQRDREGKEEERKRVRGGRVRRKVGETETGWDGEWVRWRAGEMESDRKEDRGRYRGWQAYAGLTSNPTNCAGDVVTLS